MADITLAIDAGGSQTKVIYALSDGVRRCLSMPPEIEKIKKQRLEEYFARQAWVGSPAPTTRAWVAWEDEVFVLGRFAQNFNPEDHIKERKYENALYKVLAILGIIVAEHQIPVPPRRKLTVALGILLPWNEYNDRSLFETPLKKMLADFKFQQTALKVELTSFLCRPEGGGIAASFVRSRGTAWLRSKRLGVLMFGHRNTTALYFEQGELKQGDSPLLGFSVLLDRIDELVGGLDRDKLAAALAQTLPQGTSMGARIGNKRILEEPKWVTVEAIKALASAKNATLREAEVRRIAQAIQAATEEYWEKIEQWLKKNSLEASMLDDVLIGGGATQFLRPRLEKYFNSCEQTDSNVVRSNKSTHAPINDRYPSTVIDWCTELQNQTRHLPFRPEERSDQNAIVRYVDCFGLFDYLVSTLQAAK